MNRPLLLATALIGIAGTPLGGQDVPSETDAKRILEQAISEQAEGRMRLLSFQKTDGIATEERGQRLYQLEFRVTLEILEDSKWLAEPLDPSIFTSFRTVGPPPDPRDTWAQWYRGMNPGREHKRGDRVEAVGAVHFERTETRWRLGMGFWLQEVAAQSGNILQPPTQTDAPGTKGSEPEGPTDWVPVVPGGSPGAFQHGTRVKACYVAGILVAIETRETPWNVRCEQVRNLVHAGVDITAPLGTPVHPLAIGTVEAVVNELGTREFEAIGYAVLLRHDEMFGGRDTYSVYLHLASPPTLGPGDRVESLSLVLGEVGETGAAFGPHVHVEVRHFPGWYHERWRNIYGVEGPREAGGTFDEIMFERDWSDPAALLKGRGGGPSAAVTEAGSPEGAGGTSRDPRWSQAAEAQRAGRASEFASLVAAMAESGDVLAQGWLGSLYLNGVGVERDTAKAADWFRRAADAGDPGAQYNLGDLYQQGIGVRRDPAEADRWYARAFEGFLPAAQAGDLPAQYRVGLMLEYGGGVERDLQAAASWFERASQEGHPPSQRELGLLYLEGKGVPRDRDQAIRLLQLAARAGDTMAQDQLRKLRVNW